MDSIPSRSRLLSTAYRRDLALKRYGRGANLVAMTGVPSKPPSRNISPMILSEAPLPYISAVSKRVTPSVMLARKALPTSLRSYSLPYPHSLVEPHAQAPTPRGATFSSSARPILSSLCIGSPLVPSPRYPRAAARQRATIVWSVGTDEAVFFRLAPRTGPAGARTRAGSCRPSVPPRQEPPTAAPGTAETACRTLPAPPRAPAAPRGRRGCPFQRRRAGWRRHG